MKELKETLIIKIAELLQKEFLDVQSLDVLNRVLGTVCADLIANPPE